MDRKEELIKIIGNDKTLLPLVDEVIYIEEQLAEVKKLPFLKVHPKDKTIQKATPASKLYKELLQQYNNSLRLLLRATGNIDNAEEESPLRQWLKEWLKARKDLQ